MKKMSNEQNVSEVINNPNDGRTPAIITRNEQAVALKCYTISKGRASKGEKPWYVSAQEFLKLEEAAKFMGSEWVLKAVNDSIRTAIKKLDIPFVDSDDAQAKINTLGEGMIKIAELREKVRAKGIELSEVVAEFTYAISSGNTELMGQLQLKMVAINGELASLNAQLEEREAD